MAVINGHSLIDKNVHSKHESEQCYWNNMKYSEKPEMWKHFFLDTASLWYVLDLLDIRSIKMTVSQMQHHQKQ